ncbi:claudin-18-like [Platichthys flesus]|uniref:claudin-18-like n=1 Tax=Platichthys flesus TaxID=8260 RepID=UPI002DC055C3|nr:claudin-18-like [Platichthys flesus]
MVAAGLQILGIALCIIGWIGAIVACALPQWKVTAFIGQNIVTAQTTWEGIWMTCVVQSTGQMQCKVYDSMLALSQDLQAARALIIVAIILGVLGILLSIAGGKCTNCVEDEATKAKVCVASGVIFIITGVMLLIPVSWTANTVIQDFYNPLMMGSQKRELGAALFIGWGGAALLIIGGAFLCANCPPKDNFSAKYNAPRSSAPRDYVSGSVPLIFLFGFKAARRKMVSQGIQMIGISMSVIGWFMVVVVCALPMWKVTAFIGANIITAQTIWQGMWMNCVVQSTGQMQCKVYDSMLALPQDLQAARAMTIISILTGIFGVVVAIAGGKCTNCIEDERSKAKASILAGVLFIVSGLLCLIPVSWSANTIITNFYNPMMLEAQRYELGAALYIGWAAAALLLLGGALLCWNCPPKHEQPHYAPKFTPVRSTSTSREYV